MIVATEFPSLLHHQVSYIRTSLNSLRVFVDIQIQESCENTHVFSKHNPTGQLAKQKNLINTTIYMDISKHLKNIYKYSEKYSKLKTLTNVQNPIRLIKIQTKRDLCPGITIQGRENRLRRFFDILVISLR